MQQPIRRKSAITIYKANLNDVEDLVILWSELMQESSLIDKHYSTTPIAADRLRSEFINTLRDPSVLHLIAKNESGKALGFTTAYISKPSACFVQIPIGMLENMYVSPEIRRQGVGSRMARTVLNWFSKLKINRVLLNVLAGNEVGYQFWTSLGFIPNKHILSFSFPE